MLERLRAFDRRYATWSTSAWPRPLPPVLGLGGRAAATRPSLWLVAALIAPLIFRRRAPMTVFLVVSAVAFVQWLVTGPALADVVAPRGALHRGPRVGVAGGGGGLGHPRGGRRHGHRALEARPATRSSRSSSSPGWPSPRCWPASWCARCAASWTGWPSAPQRLELERDQQASLAAAAERARIAREMHDVVSHNIQVMVTLADAASAAQASDPARAAEAMHEVSSTGRQA